MFTDINIPARKHILGKDKIQQKKARLDYFLVTSQFLDLILESTIIQGYRTAHSMIKLKIQLNKFVRGPGVWKFNCSLLFKHG